MCKALTEYDEKTEREYLRKEALDEGREEGEERVRRLYVLLLEQNRQEDMRRAISEPEFQKQLLAELNP